MDQIDGHVAFESHLFHPPRKELLKGETKARNAWRLLSQAIMDNSEGAGFSGARLKSFSWDGADPGREGAV